MVTNGGHLILSALVVVSPSTFFHTNLTAPSTFFYDRSNCAAELVYSVASPTCPIAASIRLRTLSSMARRGPLASSPRV